MASPTRESLTTSADDTGATASVSLPATINSGDLLIMIVGVRATTIEADVTGWTLFSTSGGSQTQQRCWWREADGTEGSTVTVDTNSGQWSAGVYRFTDMEDPDTQAPEAANDYADTDETTPDPPSLTPTGGAKDYYWICAFFHRGDGGTPTYPTNYSNGTTVVSLSNRSGYADRALNASSEDPGTFTTGEANDWSAVTIAVHPVGAGGGSITPQVMHHMHQMT